MLVVGGREVEAETVSLHKRDGSRVNAMPVVEFIELAASRIKNRSLEL